MNSIGLRPARSQDAETRRRGVSREQPKRSSASARAEVRQREQPIVTGAAGTGRDRCGAHAVPKAGRTADGRWRHRLASRPAARRTRFSPGSTAFAIAADRHNTIQQRNFVTFGTQAPNPPETVSFPASQKTGTPNGGTPVRMLRNRHRNGGELCFLLSNTIGKL